MSLAPRPRLGAALALAGGFPAGGLQEGAAAPDVAWTVLEPAKLASAGGATFTTLFDRSILVSGATPEHDVWTLDFETELGAVTGLRVEALADDSLPQRGPGRAADGRFVLSELVVRASAKHALRWRTVTLQNASCDAIENRRRPEQVHDGDELTVAAGWSVAGGADHELVVETKNDVRFDGVTLLRLELHFHGEPETSLGRVRISATDQPRPLRARGGTVEEPASRLRERVNAAIDRGVDWLLGQQQIDGSWNHEQWTYRNGATALATYTLVKSGLSGRHPAVVRALECMRGFPSRETYTLGCQLLALAAIDDPAVVPWMRDLAETLLSFQRDGFNYPWGNVDLSNTQYGVLGLRAAASRGVKIPAEAFESAAQQALQFAHEERGGPYGALGFSYNRGARPTSSMTVAGIAILAIADEQLRGRSRGHLAAARRGVEWLNRHWSVQQNQNEGHDRWNIYYLYGLERVGSVMSIDKVGEHDWYREGARHLVDTQGAKGEWSSSYKDHVIDTCFALLFLNRATAAASGQSAGRVRIYGRDDPEAPVSLRASGDTPLTMWISSIGEASLAAHEWPGEPQRGLRVKRVDYLAAGGAFGAGESVVASVTADGRQPAGRERFAAQASFPLPGSYAVRARVTALSAPGAAGAAPGDVVLESAPLEVRIEEAMDPLLLEYARDPLRNLLAGQRVEARASSQLNNDWPPQHAVDNLQCRGWAAASGDPLPVLTLELGKPVRAATCLLTPARIGEEYGSRITKVALTLNGKLPPIVVDVAPAGEQRKIRIPFAQPQVVRRIEVKVLARQECANPEKAVGIAEVELQADR